MGQQAGAPKKTTLKMKNAIMDYILNPSVPLAQIAERNQVKYKSFLSAIRREKEWIDEQSMEIWKGKKIMAMRMAEHLAERGNWRAIEFILRANDINPEQKVVQKDSEIHITIDKQDE